MLFPISDRKAYRQYLLGQMMRQPEACRCTPESVVELVFNFEHELHKTEKELIENRTKEKEKPPWILDEQTSRVLKAIVECDRRVVEVRAKFRQCDALGEPERLKLERELNEAYRKAEEHWEGLRHNIAEIMREKGGSSVRVR